MTSTGRCTEISNDGLAALTKLWRLSSLTLGGYGSNITDEGLQHVVKLEKLVSLNIEECHNITFGGLMLLHQLTNKYASFVYVCLPPQSLKKVRTVRYVRRGVILF